MKEQKYHFQVNLGGILDILSKHLYKSPDVFVRELLQNGEDAVTLRKKRQPGWEEGHMDITITENEQLIFSDNGAGLNEEEVHRFLAVIGQSSKTIQNGAMPQDYIGRFGIGLLSCFMVSDTIVVNTKRAGEEDGFCWCGYPDGTYTLEKKADCKEGTSIFLKTKHGTKDYYREEKIIQLVRYYGLYLKTPVYVNGSVEAVNDIPWQFQGTQKSQQLAFGEWLLGEPFLDVIPIRTKHLFGAAYILSHETAATSKQKHRIYLKNMLLTEDGSTLLPPWAFFLRCVLNTNGLQPTASREDFYEDEELEETQKEFCGAVKNYLIQLQREDGLKLSQMISVHENAVKSLAIWDEELFSLFIPYLRFQTSDGVITGTTLCKKKCIYYVDTTEKFKQFCSFFRSQGNILTCTAYMYEKELLQKMEQSGMIELKLVLEENMEWFLQELDVVEEEQMKSFLEAAKRAMCGLDCDVKMRRFFQEDVPALYAQNEETAFLREIEKAQAENGLFSMAFSSMFSEKKQTALASLYLNMENPLLQKMAKNETIQPKTIINVVRILYIQAMLASSHTPTKEEWNLFHAAILHLVEEKI